MIARNKVVLGLLLSSVFLISLFIPGAPATANEWRLISPTEYTGFPHANMHGVYMLSGGTSGKGSGSGWMVGDQGSAFHWDGFSWNPDNLGPSTDCQLNSVNFGGPLNPLTSITSTAGWLVGGVGAGSGTCSSPVAYFYNGVGWTSYSSGLSSYSTSALRGVFLVSPSLAYAVGSQNVGSDGSFFVWNGIPGSGGGWSIQTPSPLATGTPMNSVYMTQCTTSSCVAASDGFAVGNGGAMYRWQSGVWISVSSGVTTNLNGVAMSSPTRGWAVGDSCTILSTANGNTWSTYSPSPCSSPTLKLLSVILVSSSEGWIVGAQTGGFGTIIHGTSLDSSPHWDAIPNGAQVSAEPALNAVTFASSGGNIWAAGDSGVVSFCFTSCSSEFGAYWSTTTAPGLVDLNSVFMSSDSDGFAVGNPHSSSEPTILRWDGGTFSWRRAPSTGSITVAPLFGVFQSSGSAGWAVGGTAAGAPSTFWYDGNTWTGKPVSSPPTTFQFRSVYMVSDSNSFAVGGFPNGGAGPHIGVIMRSTGSPGASFGSSGSYPGLATTDLYSVYFDPTSGGMRGWVVGGNGGGSPPVISGTTDGGATWSSPINPAGIPNGVILKTLFIQDSTHGWAAGTESTILFYNGNSWSQVGVNAFTGPVDIRGIFVLGGPPATEGFAVGTDQTTHLPVILHYDGTSWSQVNPSHPLVWPGALNGLAVRSSTNGLAVGTEVNSDPLTLSTIVHLDPPGGVIATNNGNPNPATTQQQQNTATTSTQSSSVTTNAGSSTQSSSTATTAGSSATSTTTPVSGTSNSVTATSHQSSATSALASAATSSLETPMQMPAIPGFPWESIILGVIVGLTILGIARRRRRAADR